MSIFTRFRDIISSNINAMLDKAEDPEKLIKLMIQEMEDTLVEIKSSCAGVMAKRTRVQRSLSDVRAQLAEWEGRAELAIRKGREDLAREALAIKRRITEEVNRLEAEEKQFGELITQYQDEMQQLEGKLATAREKHRTLVARATKAQQRKRSQTQIRQADSNDAFVRFQKMESKIERMEADADLVNYGRKPTLDEEFADLEMDSELEEELSTLKNKVANESKQV